MGIYEIDFLLSLALTLGVEVLLLWLVLRRLFKQPATVVPLGQLLFAGVLASCATLPYLWFVLPAFIRGYVLFTIVGEVSVTLLEAVIYRFALRLTLGQALAVSLICNAVSFLAGEALKMLH